VVKDLENTIKQTTTIQPPIAPPVTPPPDSSYGGIQDTGLQFYLVDLTPYGGKKGSPRKVKNIEVDDGSWIRLKATHEKRLSLDITLPVPVSASSIAIVSNLDNAHYVKDDVTTTVLTVYTKSGNHRFEIKAGVHSSEWNRGETGGADHRFPKENHLGDKRWLAVFNLPQGSVITGMRFDHRDTDKKYYHAGAAPGFCLRGITLIRNGISGGFTGSGNTVSTDTQKGNLIFNNGNISGVYNNPTKPTTFTIKQSHVITKIVNYHWNNAKGALPGTIALKDQSGRTYGPWQAKGSPGQGGVPNAYWNVYPNITLPAGTYTVIDSDPSTWAQNGGSGGAGHTQIEGYPVQGNQTTTTPQELNKLMHQQKLLRLSSLTGLMRISTYSSKGRIILVPTIGLLQMKERPLISMFHQGSVLSSLWQAEMVRCLPRAGGSMIPILYLAGFQW